MPGQSARSTLDVRTRPATSPRPAVAPAPTFRPDVQALRAVAVSAVVLYHLFPTLLPGGFIGVDVFFVISGFLITQHLYLELQSSGRIRVTQFWARRLRRLMPAAFVVLGASTLMVLTLMPRLTWQPNLQETAASAAYVQNWLLAFHAVDYLAAENSATVAQHYWSLSVEEQFYVGWPLLLLALVGIAGRGSARRGVLSVLALVGTVSFAVSLWLTETRPDFAFFATPARAWEFAAGGLLSTLLAGRRPAAVARWGAASGWAGLAIIVASCVLLDGSRPFPGLLALLPVGGAVLVLVGGGPGTGRWAPSSLASWRPLQWVGDQSYAIYLWHWPLLIVGAWVLHRPDAVWPKLVVLALTLVLAALTRRYVEDPVRRGPAWLAQRRPTYLLTAVGMAVLLVASSTVYLHVQSTNQVQTRIALDRTAAGAPCYGAAALQPGNTCPAPFARPADLDLAFAASDIWPATDRCQEGQETVDLTTCNFGELEAPTRTIVVVGNSHALRLVPALELYGKQRGWKIILAAKTDCMGLITTPIPHQPSQSCLVWSSRLQRALLALPQLDAVVFASHVGAQQYLVGADPSPDDLRLGGQQVVSTWSALRQRGTRVVVTEDIPGMRPVSDPECLAASAAGYDPCALPRAQVVVPNLMTELAQQNRDLVTYIPLSQDFCDASLCHAIVGGVVVYTDSHHLSRTMARSMAGSLGPAVEAALS